MVKALPSADASICGPAQVNESVSLIATTALVGKVAGEEFALETAGIQLRAQRAEAAKLPGSSLACGAHAAFVLPDAAILAAQEQGAEDSIDVQTTAFARNMFSYASNGELSVGQLSELTLRLGSQPIVIGNLSEPVRTRVPFAATPDEADDNPYYGAQCGEGSREQCEEELHVLNESYNTQNAACKGSEDDFFNLFRPSVFRSCKNETETARRIVEWKEEECERLSIAPCSGRGYCNGSTCVCEGPYYGSSCGRRLRCSFWNGSAFSWDGCVEVGWVNGSLLCDCNHLTIFSMMWDVDFSSSNLFGSIGFPYVSLPFSRFDQLLSGLLSLGWQLYTLMGGLAVFFVILLGIAHRRDRDKDFVGYMPKWFIRLRQVADASHHSDSYIVRLLAWLCVAVLFFVTNHPYIVVALVKPGDGYKHAHLLMLLLQTILVELCIFTVFFVSRAHKFKPALGPRPSLDLGLLRSLRLLPLATRACSRISHKTLACAGQHHCCERIGRRDIQARRGRRSSPS